MMRAVLAGIVALVLLLAPAVALAKLPAEGSGSIQRTPGSNPTFQGLVSFDTTGTSGLKNPRVWVAAYQGGQLVYGEGGAPSDTFKLGGDSSQWVLNGGGSAECSARLYYILGASGKTEWNGNTAQGGTVTLATTDFGC